MVVEHLEARGRRRGRERAEAGPRSSLPAQRPFAQPRLTHGPTTIASDDQIEAIHVASLRILSELGMKVVDDDTLAFDAIASVGPGGHFFGTDHTQARFRTEFYRPMISDWRNYETWEEAGSPDAVHKANQLVKAFLAEYEEPPIDATIKDALTDFVARRTAEGGVPVDY